MSESNIVRQFGDIAPTIIGSNEKRPVPAQNKDERQKITELMRSVQKGCADGDMEETGDGEEFLTHYFAPGVYCREYFLKAGSLIIGKIHKTAHMSIISMGKVTVRTQYGFETIEAPHTWMSEIGTQRAIFAHEDTLWTTIHPTDLTDIDEIVETLATDTYDDIDALLLEQDGDKI